MKKIFTLIICIAVTLSLFSLNAYAYETVNSSDLIAQSGEISIFAADVIVLKTRIYNGRYQYRRWNETKKRWVDPYWIYG